MPHRFLQHRAAIAMIAAQRTLDTSTAQVERVVVHAAALADRIEALPPLGDLDQRRQRRERVERLRTAVARGEAALRLRAVDPGQGRRSDGSAL